jgi:hypothetical protein
MIYLETLYSIIERINESGLLLELTLIFIAICLVRLYLKREVDENNLALKIIGFYVLGRLGIEFKLGWFILAIPVGFCIALFIFKKIEMKNKRTKFIASILGVSIFILSALNSMLYTKIDYRERSFTKQNETIYNLVEGYNLVKKSLGIKYSFMISMNLDYYNDSRIKSLQYRLKDDKNFYDVSYEDGLYKITTTLAGDYESDVVYNAEEILKIVSNTKFNNYEEASYINMRFTDTKQFFENMDFYLINRIDYSVENLARVVRIYECIGLASKIELKDSILNEVYLIQYGKKEYK